MSYGGVDRGPTTLAVVWSTTAVAGVVTWLRMLSRTALSKTFGLDDSLMLLAFLGSLAYSVAISEAIRAGFGLHLYTVKPSQRPEVLYRNVVQNAIGVWSFALPKLSIMALLQRLLGLSIAVRVLFWILCFTLLGGSCALSVVWVNQCSPAARQWDMSIPGSCLNTNVLLHVDYFVSSFSAFMDFLFAVYPPFIIARLQMPLSQRVLISLALSGGIVSGIVATFKTTLLSLIDVDSWTDPTWAQVPLVLWRSVEVNCLIIFTSLPTIGPSVRFGRRLIAQLCNRDIRAFESTSTRSNPTSRHRGKFLTWKGVNDKGMVALTSEQDDVQSGKNMSEPCEDSSKTAPRYESTEILRTVDMETIIEEVKPHDRLMAKTKLGLSPRDFT